MASTIFSDPERGTFRGQKLYGRVYIHITRRSDRIILQWPLRPHRIIFKVARKRVTRLLVM